MAELWGNSYTRAELLARVGDISQIARVKPYRLTEGLEDGVLALDVTTGSGLDFTVLPSRGMDISMARYNGRSLAWRSATTDAHPAYFDHEGENGRGWLRGFAGGLVTTCGLTYAGANGLDEGQLYGLHGRISNLPATKVSWGDHWEGDNYSLVIDGIVRQTTVFGENLQLHRKIITNLAKPNIYLLDEVKNLGYQTTPHMMLYHINIGFPVVSEHSRLIAPSLAVTPRDEDAVAGLERYAQFEPPQQGFREQVYFHELAMDAKQQATAAIVNPELDAGDGKRGLGVYCRYRPEQLPRFIEWKMMGLGEYVVGMEPANCLVGGRAKEREAGTLQMLEPGEKKSYVLEIGVVSGEEEIAQLEAQAQRAIEVSKQGNAKS